MRTVAMVIAVMVGLIVGRCASAEQTGAGKLDGTWLAARAEGPHWSDLFRAWTSVVTVGKGEFAVSHYLGSSQMLRGRIVLDAGGEKGAVDLDVDAIDMSEKWPGMTYPRCVLQGIYRVAGDGVEICLRLVDQGQRPKAFVAEDEDTVVLRLERAKEGFAEFPKEVAVRVVDGQRKAAAGATVFTNISHMEFTGGKGTGPGMKIYGEKTADSDGIARVAYEKLDAGAVWARDERRGLIGLAEVSPASLQGGEAVVRLEPACLVKGRVTSEAWKLPGVRKWSCVYLMQRGERLASYSSFAGMYAFSAPPGEYELWAYGEELKERYVKVSVAAGEKQMEVPPVALEATKFLTLVGELAPELVGVEAWRGEPVKLAALRGKVVLLHFWGYWCPSCVAEMPMWMELDEKFRGKGLVIVEVHEDDEGEVDTVGKYEEKVALLKKDWSGKEPGFPMALTSGKKAAGVERVPDRYGVDSFPTTVVIDRQGKVAGKLVTLDEKDAEEKIEKLLGE